MSDTQQLLPLAPDLFILGGNSTFTLKSRKSGKHFTYRARADESDPKRVYVSVLTGGENERDYSFLGTIFRHNDIHAVFRHGKKSKISPEAQSAAAFRWFWDHAKNPPPAVEFIKSGRCCRCNRVLTTPESVAAGIGPECSKLSR